MAAMRVSPEVVLQFSQELPSCHGTRCVGLVGQNDISSHGVLHNVKLHSETMDSQRQTLQENKVLKKQPKKCDKNSSCKMSKCMLKLLIACKKI